jgi:parallel beta-helix repeat protein
MAKKLAFIAALVFFSIFLNLSVSNADTNITDCTIINESGNYFLQNDILNSTADICIDIQASNVYLDLQGHIIEGKESPYHEEDIGIQVFNENLSLENITIINGFIRNWILGIYLESANNLNLTNDTFMYNREGITLYNVSEFFLSESLFDSNYGSIVLDASRQNKISNILFSDTLYWDIRLKVYEDNQCDNIIENTTGSNGKPILFYNESNLIIENMEASALMLCNADNSIINNVTINNPNKNNGVYIARTENARLSNLFINNSHEVYIGEDSNNISLLDSYISFNENGIYFENITNSLIKNCNVLNNSDYGIYFGRSFNNKILDSIVADNGGYEEGMDFFIGLDDPPYFEEMYCNNIIENVTGTGGKQIFFSNNSNQFIENIDASEAIFCNTDNSVIKNLTINHIRNGLLWIVASDNSTFQNLLVNDSIGSYLFIANNTKILNSTFSYNYWGLVAVGTWNTLFSGNIVKANCKNNHNDCMGVAFGDGNIFAEISHNRIEENQLGLILDDIYNSTAYNNFFNNDLNLYYDSTVFHNPFSFNTTLTSGTNIVGGPYIGGNYWAYPNGTGFSQTCSDSDNNGICDSPYIIDENITDFLPLKLWSAPQPPAPTPPPSQTPSSSSNNHHHSQSSSSPSIISASSSTNTYTANSQPESTSTNIISLGKKASAKSESSINGKEIALGLFLGIVLVFLITLLISLLKR